MKDFLKYVLATVVGIIVVSLICTILSVITLLGMASKSTKSVPNDAVLVLKLEGSISERSQDNPLGSILGSNTTQLGLDDILKAIRNAQNNDKVKGIYIDIFTQKMIQSSEKIPQTLEHQGFWLEIRRGK